MRLRERREKREEREREGNIYIYLSFSLSNSLCFLHLYEESGKQVEKESDKEERRY